MDFGSECFIVETVTDCDAVTDESVLYHPFQTFHPEPSNYGLTIHENSFTPALSDNLQFDDVNSDLQQQEECELDDLYDFRYLKRAVEISLRRLERAAASRSREEFRLALPLFTDRVMLLVRHCVEDIDNNVAETPRL
nr:TPA_asm: oncoid [Astyanax tetra cavefish adintovirus]